MRTPVEHVRRERTRAWTPRLIVALMTLLLATTGHGLTLPYSEGGPAVENPGADLSPVLRRYVDAMDGDDTNDGKSPGAAWQSLKKVAEERSRLKPETHILFRRGQTWRGGLVFTDVHGVPGQRLTLGAYGAPLSKRPKIEGTVTGTNSSYLMIRDFDCIKIDTSGKAHHIVVFDNVVHGSPEKDEWPSNGIRVFGPAHHIAIVQNLVYDLSANDCIVIHPDNGKIGVRGHFWVVDNICIGNSKMEDGIDLAMSEPEHGTDDFISGDVKVLNNRVQMKALDGLSARKGRGAKVLSAGHAGRHVWIVGNTMGGGGHIGVKLGEKKDGVQFSGNVIFSCAQNSTKLTCELFSKNIVAQHNTIIHTIATRSPVGLPGDRYRFLRNLTLNANRDGRLIDASPRAGKSIVMDHNWYSPSGEPKLGGLPWDQWRADTGRDTHSSIGPAPGVTAPDDTPFSNDPRNWREPAFVSHFIPDSSWPGCDGENTPGAFDCEGNRLGLTLRPFADLQENDGFGWEGPPIIQAKYPIPGTDGE